MLRRIAAVSGAARRVATGADPVERYFALQPSGLCQTPIHVASVDMRTCAALCLSTPACRVFVHGLSEDALPACQLHDRRLCQPLPGAHLFFLAGIKGV